MSVDLISEKKCPIVLNCVQTIYSTEQRFELAPKLILTVASIWRETMLGYLSADIICSEKRTVF